MLPFGSLFVPFTGPMFHKFGMVRSILVFEFMTVCFLLPELISDLDLQYLTFTAVTCLRCVIT